MNEWVTLSTLPGCNYNEPHAGTSQVWLHLHPTLTQTLLGIQVSAVVGILNEGIGYKVWQQVTMHYQLGDNREI